MIYSYYYLSKLDILKPLKPNRLYISFTYMYLFLLLNNKKMQKYIYII